MNARPLFLIAFIIPAIALSGCWYRCKDGPRYHDLPDWTQDYIPYSKSNTLKMVDPVGNVNNFRYVEGKYEYLEDVECTECCEEYWQSHNVTLQGDNPATTIVLSLDGLYAYQENDPINWQVILANDAVFTQLDGPTFQSGDHAICHDCLTVQGKVYQDVLEVVGRVSLIDAIDSSNVARVWYNPKSGILKYKQQGGVVWEKI